MINCKENLIALLITFSFSTYKYLFFNLKKVIYLFTHLLILSNSHNLFYI